MRNQLVCFVIVVFLTCNCISSILENYAYLEKNVIKLHIVFEGRIKRNSIEEKI